MPSASQQPRTLYDKVLEGHVVELYYFISVLHIFLLELLE